MKREFLESLEIEKEKIETIMGEYGKSINTLKNEKEEVITKYSELQNQFNELDKNFKSSSSNYESLEKQLNDLKPKYEEASNKLFDYETIQKMNEFGVDERFNKFVKTEVQGLVTDEIKFEDALTKYLEENPQYKKSGEVKKLNSSISFKGNAEKTMSKNEIMNNAILNALNK